MKLPASGLGTVRFFSWQIDLRGRTLKLRYMDSDWKELNVYIFLAFNRENGIPAIDTVLPAGTLKLWLPAQNSIMEVYWSNLDRP